MKECISGASFADVVINTFFSFSPSPDGATALADPETPRPFSARLRHLRFNGSDVDLITDSAGVHLHRDASASAKELK